MERLMEEIIATGDFVEIKTKSGEKFRIPCIKVMGNKAFFNDGFNKLQLNQETKSISVLKNRRDKGE